MRAPKKKIIKSSAVKGHLPSQPGVPGSGKGAPLSQVSQAPRGNFWCQVRRDSLRASSYWNPYSQLARTGVLGLVSGVVHTLPFAGHPASPMAVSCSRIHLMPELQSPQVTLQRVPDTQRRRRCCGGPDIVSVGGTWKGRPSGNYPESCQLWEPDGCQERPGNSGPCQQLGETKLVPPS